MKSLCRLTSLQAAGNVLAFRMHWEVEMTTSEQKVLWRGVAAGTIMGLALGLMIALFIAIRPDVFRALMP